MNKNQALVKDVKGALVGVALGQIVLWIGSTGMSKEKKNQTLLGGLICSSIVWSASVVVNESCRRIFK